MDTTTPNMSWDQYPDSLGGKSDKTTEGQNLKMERREPTYYARIPLMAQLELDPYELALYTNYKQTCAEFGECFKSNNTLATETHMSITKVKEARRSLASKGYISIEYATAPEANHSTPPTVTITDVWEVNHSLGESRKGGRHTPTPSRQKTTPSRHTPTNKNSLVKTKNKAKESVAPAVQRRQYLSFAEQHPDLSEDELQALALKSMQEQTAQDKERIAWNTDEAKMLEAVKILPGVSGKLAQQYAHQMRGTAKKGEYGEYKIPDGLWSWEFTEWAGDYRKAYPGVALPKQPDLLHGHIMQWLEKKAAKAQAAASTAQADNWTFDAYAHFQANQEKIQYFDDVTKEYLGTGTEGLQEKQRRGQLK